MFGLNVRNDGSHDVAADFGNLPLTRPLLIFIGGKEAISMVLVESVVRSVGAAQRALRTVFGEEIAFDGDRDRIAVQPKIHDIGAGGRDGRLAAVGRMRRSQG